MKSCKPHIFFVFHKSLLLFTSVLGLCYRDTMWGARDTRSITPNTKPSWGILRSVSTSTEAQIPRGTIHKANMQCQRNPSAWATAFCTEADSQHCAYSNLIKHSTFNHRSLWQHVTSNPQNRKVNTSGCENLVLTVGNRNTRAKARICAVGEGQGDLMTLEPQKCAIVSRPRSEYLKKQGTQHNSTQHNTIQHNTTRRRQTRHTTTSHTTQHNTPYDTTRHHTTQHNTIRHNLNPRAQQGTRLTHQPCLPQALRLSGSPTQRMQHKRGQEAPRQSPNTKMKNAPLARPL